MGVMACSRNTENSHLCQDFLQTVKVVIFMDERDHLLSDSALGSQDRSRCLPNGYELDSDIKYEVKIERIIDNDHMYLRKSLSLICPDGAEALNSARGASRIPVSRSEPIVTELHIITEMLHD